jgi:uncharacterized protein (DUF1697 family)
MGRPIAVTCRTVGELRRVLDNNPFPEAEPARVGIMFLSEKVGKAFLAGFSTTTGEEVKAGKREVYVYYPIGMGRSKLKVPKAAEKGTIRNTNTVRKIIELCEA